MIPYRIRLTGFLSYRDEQILDFNGSPVWMLTGQNGSGKSAIFDAITFALYGDHRGGSSGHKNLINNESQNLSVTFDFTIDGRLYRVTRSVSKKRAGSQQAYALPVGGDPNGNTWEPIPDTSKTKELDTWLEDKIGMNYETFTTSVLLLQGKSEKLLNFKPSERYDVLGEIVDTSRYQQLQALANRDKNKLAGSIDLNKSRVAGITDVTDEQLAASTERIIICQQAHEAAKQAYDSLATLEVPVARYGDAVERLVKKQRLADDYVKLIESAKQIESAHARFTELNGVLPAAYRVIATRGDAEKSKEASKKFEGLHEEAKQSKTQVDHEHDKAKRNREVLKKQVKSDEEMKAIVDKRLLELSGARQTLDVIDQHEADLQKLLKEQSKLPQDAEALARKALEHHERCDFVSRHFPNIQRIADERKQLATLHVELVALKATETDVTTRGKAVKGELDKLQAELKLAREKKSQSDNTLALASARCERAEASLKQFKEQREATACPACGQKLTKEHFAEEKKRREVELTAAKAELKTAEDTAKEAATAETAAIREEARSNKAREELINEYKVTQEKTKSKTAAIESTIESLKRRYDELAPEFRKLIAPKVPADWSAITYPTSEDLASLKREADQLKSASQAKQDAQANVDKLRAVTLKMESVRKSLESLKKQLPEGEPAQIRKDCTNLETQEVTLKNTILTTRKLIDEAEQSVERLGRESHTTAQRLVELIGFINLETQKQKSAAETIANALELLPEAWRDKARNAGMTDFSKWKIEREELFSQGIEAQYQQLQKATIGVNTLRQEIAELQKDLEAFPENVRMTMEELQRKLVASRLDRDARNAEFHQAKQAEQKLQADKAKRDEIGKETLALQSAFERMKTLADILGPKRLQLFLVRRAEKQIVMYANEMLKKLSNNQLELRLISGEDGTGTPRALDLECINREIGGGPINVSFLSGSQRFRVSVSLALAIGQYASRRQRPIESVIIDEGFGCLDREGRATMIQELQNLKQTLKRIVLVSHQEEFADAFQDVYRFELKNGSTKVTRR